VRVPGVSSAAGGADNRMDQRRIGVKPSVGA
jgi:hypothetical protein